MKIINKKTKKHTKLHITICLQCGIEFGSYVNNSKVCSKKCSNIYVGLKIRKGKYKKCLVCNKDFWEMPSEPKKSCSNKCRNINKKLGLPTGEYYSYDGYIVINRLKDGRKQIKKHRFIMEQYIGRILNPKEIVHHINENKIDNRIENLQIVSRIEHNKIHRFLEKTTT